MMTSVFLIIGAAIIGPVYPQINGPQPPGAYEECIEDHIGWPNVRGVEGTRDTDSYCRDYKRPHETLEQLAFRLMRDVGVDEQHMVANTKEGEFINAFGWFEGKNLNVMVIKTLTGRRPQ